MQSIRRKAYICKNCECVYADEPVTACDCMPDKNEYWVGHIDYEIESEPAIIDTSNEKNAKD